MRGSTPRLATKRLRSLSIIKINRAACPLWLNAGKKRWME
ncbi:TPA_asm: hypothetical protein [Porphyromonas phage phage018a_AFR5B1]|uniref:Uncharacterized protein n=1 Tax=Porphyromonas phage phage018a_AFR5B1 TaxID=3154108 RepID=A0AAT9J8F8_9CAUD